MKHDETLSPKRLDSQTELMPTFAFRLRQVSKDDCEHLDQLRMEITVLSTLDHPRVLHFFEAYEDFKDTAEMLKGVIPTQ